MRFALIAITIMGLFGSLSLFTPKMMWNDFSYFFRKNKAEYLAFSNQFRGKFLLLLAIISFTLFVLSFVLDYNIKSSFVFIVFLAYILIAHILLEIKWRKR